MKASRRGPGVWEVDFQHLSWSAPGGVNLQFGVVAVARAGSASNSRHGTFGTTAQMRLKLLKR